MADRFHDWYHQLEREALADLRFAEVRRAVQAVSRLYVHARHRLPEGNVFTGRGKRAAFSLFYGPMHFAVVRELAAQLGGVQRPDTIWDLGCGTGVAGAAWATHWDPPARVRGCDTSGWAVAAARQTYDYWGVSGRAQRGPANGVPLGGSQTDILCAYLINELSEEERERLQEQLLAAHGKGARVLVIEPVAKRVAPWWPALCNRWAPHGARETTWILDLKLPERWHALSHAAGLDHRRTKVRTLWLA